MQKRALGSTGLEIAPVVFGGNVLGWTIDEATSFKVLDAFVDQGFNAIDTADSYSRWVDGNKGGESEAIIGNWLKANPGKRDQVVIFTKVGSDMGQGKRDLSAKWILEAVEHSLRRLRTDYIDLYFSHWPDESVGYDETLLAYHTLIKAGKVRSIGVSNVDAAQLRAALKVAEAEKLPRYQVLQPEYNLLDRSSFEGALRDLCLREKIGVVTYYSLASGFLSGKYRSKADLGQSQRGGGVKKYMDERGMKVLEALDKVSEAHDAKPAEVALAWLMAAKGVTAPIASATKASQVESFAKAAGLKLTGEDKVLLDKAGR